MAITTFLAVATTALVMAAWFVLPAASRPRQTVAVHEETAEFDLAA